MSSLDSKCSLYPSTEKSPKPCVTRQERIHIASALKGLSDEMDIFREACQIKSECSLRVLIVFKCSKVLQTISAHTVYSILYRQD